jgi:hypothetical protein
MVNLAVKLCRECLNPNRYEITDMSWITRMRAFVQLTPIPGINKRTAASEREKRREQRAKQRRSSALSPSTASV